MPPKKAAKKKASKSASKNRNFLSQNTKKVKKNDDSAEVGKVPKGSPELENPLELSNLLTYINKQCKPEEKYGWRVLILPVTLREICYLGTDSFRILHSRWDKLEDLRGMLPREFLAKFWGKKPRINPITFVWVFDPFGSGPFPSRVKLIEDPSFIGTVQSAIDMFFRDLQVVHEERRKMIERASRDTPKWKLCSICNPISDLSYGFWKGGDLQSGGIPVNESLLGIIGEPFFSDSTSSRGWCIKRCPECGTCYKWDFDYEYLVNGTEDEITMVRLSDADAREWTQRVYETIHASEVDFTKRAPPYLNVLMAAANPKALQDAAFFIEYTQNVQGHDIAFTIPALVRALARHPHTEPLLKCSGYWISTTLGRYAEKKRGQAEHLLSVMQTEQPTSVGDEFKELLARTKKRVADETGFYWGTF